MKLFESIFSLLLTASLASTVIILPLLLIRKLFYKSLRSPVFHLLWFLVLVKLLVPIVPQSPISLFNLMPQFMHEIWNPNPEPVSHDASIGGYSELGATYGNERRGKTYCLSSP